MFPELRRFFYLDKILPLIQNRDEKILKLPAAGAYVSDLIIGENLSFSAF